MKRLTIKEAAERSNCPYRPATLRDYIHKGILRRIVVRGGEGEYVKIGKRVFLVEANFDLWLHRRTYPSPIAEEYGVPMAMKGRKQGRGA